MTDRTDEVLIVGAGIVGAACAEACARLGLSTTVVASGIGDGATAAGMGHLVVMDDSPAQFALTRSGVALWTARAGQLPRQVEHDPCGTLWLAADARQMELAELRLAAYRSAGVSCELVSAPQLRALEPRLSDRLAGALLVHGDAVIYPPAAARHLLDRAQLDGARIERATVVSASADGVALDDGRILAARHVVIAAGLGSAALVGGLALRPKKGHLIITDRYPGWIGHQLVALDYLASAHGAEQESVAFNVQPRRGGQLLIGSSRQFDRDDAEIDRRILSRMIELAISYLPGLGGLNAIRSWTGIRPATPDHVPLIGRAARNGIWFATGHEGLGITTALATAKLLGELVSGSAPHLDPAAYSPDRLQCEPVHA